MLNPGVFDKLTNGKSDVEKSTIAVELIGSKFSSWEDKAAAIIIMYTMASDSHPTVQGIAQIIREQERDGTHKSAA